MLPSLVAALVLTLPVATLTATLESLPGGTPFTPSAQPLGRMGLTVGLGAFGHADAGMLKAKTFLFDTLGTAGAEDTAEIQDLQTGTGRFNVAFGVARNVEFGISVPYHLDITADTDAKEVSGAGLGDPSISAKAGFAVAGDHIFDMGLLATFTLPSKNPEGFLPKHTGYLSGDSTAKSEAKVFSSYANGFSVRGLMSLDLTRTESQIPFRAHLQAGVKDVGIGGTHVILGGALEWVPIPYLGFYADGQTETRQSKFGSAFGKDLAQLAGGFWANSDEGMFFSAGVQKRVSKATFQGYRKIVGDKFYDYKSAAAPDLALAVTLGWSGVLVPQDMDKDGVPDNQDPCPNEDEDKDGFQDFDGCPERDNDEDGIGDIADKCPIEPEDKDGTEDGDGCPDHDNDSDNIPDALDKCPTENEDMDNFEDYDGCPDLDNDQDGVLDQNDKCVVQAEDKDGFEDGDGCPDPDNDGDKIPDAMDKCPLEAENLNSFEDTDGCPDLSRQGATQLERRFVLKGVKFRANTTELLTSSYPALDSLAEKLKASPGTMVELRAYTDKNGSELDQFRITESWANAVRKYLLTLGVSSDQLLARGMGSRDPVAPNTTASNRAQNRRVEVHRLN